jgi:ABC-type dipeptide/oligopeptide/nickel transport system permease component
MLATLGKRLVTVIPTLIGVVIVTFLLTRVLPGDPAVYFAGPAATPQSIVDIRKSLGLDRPLPEQFARYVSDLAHGNTVIRSPPAGRWRRRSRAACRRPRN